MLFNRLLSSRKTCFNSKSEGFCVGADAISLFKVPENRTTGRPRQTRTENSALYLRAGRVFPDEIKTEIGNHTGQPLSITEYDIVLAKLIFDCSEETLYSALERMEFVIASIHL